MAITKIKSSNIADGTVVAADIADDSITNVDIKSDAAIATTKLSGALTSVASHGLGTAAALTAGTAAGNVIVLDGSGNIPSGALGNVPPSDTSVLEYNIAMLAFKISSESQVTKFQMVDQVIDEYQDATGIDAGASTNERAGGATTAKFYDGGVAANPTGGASVDTSVSGYRTHVFTADASLTVGGSGNVDILIVAGGGSGASGYGGGAGAGGLIYKASHALTANTYDAVIGAGGAAETVTGNRGQIGVDTTWTINGGAVEFTAKGGGAGGTAASGQGSLTGGSGGGGGHGPATGSAATQGSQSGDSGDRKSTRLNSSH